MRDLSDADAHAVLKIWQLVEGRRGFGIQFLQEQLKHRTNCRHLGAFDPKDNAMGIVTLGWLGPFGKLTGLVVGHDYRRQSVGRQLVKEVGKRAAGLGLQHVDLEVMSDNWGARSLYEQSGFRLLYEADHTALYRHNVRLASANPRTEFGH